MNSFRASAPVRLDLAGAWTDVAPFATEEGGVVVNAAIELRANAEVILGGQGYRLRSDDLDDQLEFATPQDFPRDGRLDLLKAALRLSDPGPCQLRTWSNAPPGSGLGSSGALDVALIAALDAARGIHRRHVTVAEEGYRLEALEAEHAGGKQDQYAAALGGFNRLDFGDHGVGVTPLELNTAFAQDLARHTIVCYTGTSRVSGDTITRVMSAYQRGDAQVVDALRTLVAIADQMTDALLTADLDAVGTLLGANWVQQQRLDPAMRTADMARLERAMASAGAIGGKAAGAGAGGSMFFVVADPDQAVAAALATGVQVLPLRWASQGIIFG
jgi:D-glycero-alpha-D-manno-heptose-7-phosphate kinase